MQSTGEVACFGPTFADALVKALVATGVRLARPNGTAFVSVGGLALKEQLLPTAQRLAALGYGIRATEDTAAFLTGRGLKRVGVLHKVSEPDRQPNVLTELGNGAIDLMLAVPSSLTQEKIERMLEDEYILRRRAVELGVPLFTSVEAFDAYVEGLEWVREHPLTVEALYGTEDGLRASPGPVSSLPLVSARRRSRPAPDPGSSTRGSRGR
jgi:carbamoyl-phosphate synthase large subunit